MPWIVTGTDKERIVLVSKVGTDGLIPKGAYVTVSNGKQKHVLRVDASFQVFPYQPSTMLVDMDLTPLLQDSKTQNIIYATRVGDIGGRSDGLIDFVKPGLVGVRSTQDEINDTLMLGMTGPRAFVATVYGGKNQVLMDDSRELISVSLPDEMFYHQILIVGKTGSGKTSLTKYLSQYFAETLEGSVLAINVKDVDLLTMNRPTKTNNEKVEMEWSSIGLKPHGVENFTVYYPACTSIPATQDIDREYFQKVTLDVKTIDPEALSGLLYGITDIASQSLPGIFRYWRNRIAKPEHLLFSGFIGYFTELGQGKELLFPSENVNRDIVQIPLHRGTYNNILRNLTLALEFFDNKEAKSITEVDVLQPGKISVINIAVKNGQNFGSIILRDLLHKIVEAKDQRRFETPIIIIIDEVHLFYDLDSSREALGDLDTITRTGRSKKIGVIFSSQTASDIPKGLFSVINTKIFFNSDLTSSIRGYVDASDEEVRALGKGYAAVSVFGAYPLKFLKFPLPTGGINE